MTKPLLPTSRSGFTLIELVIIIVVLGIISTVALVKYSDFLQSAKIEACEAELQTLKRAIVGNPQVTAGGRYTDVGFLGDVGQVPMALTELVRKPAAVPAYNPISRLGWKGPYVDSTGGDYLIDPWGVAYALDPVARTITSSGSGAAITVGF